MLQKIIIACLLLLVFTTADVWSKNLKIAIGPSWPPLEYYDDKRQIAGFSVDYAQALAQQMQIPYEIVDINRSEIFDRLLSHDVDLIISSMAITNERARIVAFSKSYLTAYQTLVVRQDNSDLNLNNMAGRRIGVKAYTTGYGIAENKGATCIGYNNITDAFRALLGGHIDGVICDSPVASHFTFKVHASKDKLKISDYVKQAEHYAVAMRQNEPEFLHRVNAAITALADNGTVDRLVGKWMGSQK